MTATNLQHTNGYLENTHSGDGSDIDVWIGSLSGKKVAAAICSVDLEKRDTEIKGIIQF